MNNNEMQPIPVTTSKPIDLQKISDEAARPQRVSLPEFNSQHGLAACVDCARGGHTRTTLIKIVKSIATREIAYACKEHVGKYIRPKDVIQKRR